MEKKIILFMLLAMMGISAVGCRRQEGVAAGNGEQGSTEEITEEKAKAIALEDASVAAENVDSVRVRKDRDDGQNVYDVEFYVGNKEYDYEIDIFTGKIRERDFDIEDDF